MDVSDSFYLVPSLIPVANSSDMKISIETMQRWTSRSTCIFAFSTTNTKSAISMSKKQAISAKDLETLCFLPSGLFERLIGKTRLGVNKHLERDLELLFIILEFIKIWHSFNMVINISEYKRYQSITVFGWMWKEYLRQQCMSGL